MQLLVEEGADVNMEDEDGDTAMHVALLRPQLANVVLSPSVGTSSTEESGDGCSSTSLYCRVRADGEGKGELACANIYLYIFLIGIIFFPSAVS